MRGGSFVSVRRLAAQQLAEPLQDDLQRVEIDGLPTEVDDAIRRVASLKAQLEGLENDVDAMSLKTRERHIVDVVLGYLRV